VLIALASALGQPLAVAVLRPAGVRTDPAPAAAPAAATAFRAPVTARAGAPEKPGEPVRVRVGAVDGDSLVVPIRPRAVLGCRADIDRGWRRCSAV
jgi:hypothetical protein